MARQATASLLPNQGAWHSGTLPPWLTADLVSAKVSELEVEVEVQHAVLWLDVAVVHAALMEVHHGQQDLGEVVTGQRF